jgi:molybdate transport system ATP-binding protein
VGSEEQRQVSLAQSSFYQARWHSLWTEPQTVIDYLSPRQVSGLNPYEVLDILPVHRNFDAERTRTLQDLELQGLEGRVVAQLSNGELRKLLLAAAHLANPKVLLLDDPMGGLAESTRQRLTQVFTRWHAEGQTIVFSTTHQNELSALTTGQWVLSRGAVMIVSAPKATTAVPAPKATTAVPAPKATTAVPAPKATTAVPAPKATTAVPAPKATTAETAPKATTAETALPQPNQVIAPVESVNTVPNAAIVRCEDVAVRMNGVTLLEGITWEVREGQHWVITGPNGSGKSTLLSLLLGDHPQSYANDIWVFEQQLGKDITLWERRRSIGYVAPELVWHYPRGVTLDELVLSGYDGSIGVYRASSLEEVTRARALFNTFNLSMLAKEPLFTLSEGTVRLGLLLRALVHQPRLLLLDEPTQELGETERGRFLEQLDTLARVGHTTIVLVTHHLDERPRCISHHLALERGKMAYQGPLV